MEIYKTPIGVLVMDGSRVIDKAVFKNDPKYIAQKMAAECAEEKLMKAKYPKATTGTVRIPLADIAASLSFCSRAEFPKFLALVNEEISKAGMRKGFGRDSLIIQAVRAQRALEESVNTQAETLREWYSIHFPELSSILKENSEYASVVANMGPRKGMTDEALSKILENQKFSKVISPVAKDSIGTEIDERDLRVIQDYAKSLLGATKEEAALRAYIETTMREIAPNISAVATAYVGGLLLEQAGSLERMATLPASTIQVLGAQKAMFRFLKTKILPPKYGVLFVHPLVSQATKANKGKIARTLASKISIAAKVDYYGGAPIGEKLRLEMERRAGSLKKGGDEKPGAERKGFDNKPAGEKKFSDNKPAGEKSFGERPSGAKPFQRGGKKKPFRFTPRGQKR